LLDAASELRAARFMMWFQQAGVERESIFA
jgi:hypothetical protein